MIKFIQRTKNDNRIRLKGESWTEDYIGVDLYFDITAEEPTTIIGGGLFNDTTIKNAIIENNRTILWGTGSSDNLHRYDASVKIIDSFIKNVKKDFALILNPDVTLESNSFSSAILFSL